MKKAGAASRYASYGSPSPRRAGPPSAAATPTHGSSRALVAARPGRDLLGAKPQPQAQHGNLGSVLRRLISIDKKPPAKNHLPVPPAAAAAATKNNGGGKLPGLSRKLFQKGSSEGGNKKKPAALTDVKNGGNNANTRSERELLAQNKARDDEVAALRLQLENKDREVERLKDLCLRQREEISALKDAVLFPDAQPGPEPDRRRLRDEVSTLTGQIKSLAQELAQVKAEKHTSRSCFEDDDDAYGSSPTTPGFNEETAFSLITRSPDSRNPWRQHQSKPVNPSRTKECSIGEDETPNYGSPDEMFSKDLNPCLTPCIAKSKSDLSAQCHSSFRPTKDSQHSISKSRVNHSYGSLGKPMSKSSDNHKPTSGSSSKRRVNKSDQDRIYQNLF